MQIGILQCDNVRSSLSSAFGDFPKMFEDGLRAVLDDEVAVTFKVYPAHESVLPECVDECQAYIITGSRHSVLDTEALWIHQLQNFIVRLNKAQVKTFGVCFGHQIMAVAFGGKVERADAGWQVGAHETTLLERADFMRPFKSPLTLAMFCEDQVVKIGETGQVLAKTKCCENAMIQYGEHMFSVQGHPEFSGDFSKALLNIRQEDFPRRRFEIGMASFSEKRLDGDVIFSWLVHFFAPPSAAAADSQTNSDN